MGKWIVGKTIKQMIASNRVVKGATVNMLGFTFKENCADVRNSKVNDIVVELCVYGVKVHVHDPLADPATVARHYGLDLTAWERLPAADAMIVAVLHQAYRSKTMAAMHEKLLPGACVVDVKSVLDRNEYEARGYYFWRL
ncbi:UDP binding domain-containing protein [Pseudomonas sp. LRF_L74]|uniref:UDP binding domain-containing protein n=1 Tax=Pseudomonas sp. LRF_L74 TaxID=3369422 RepID=UPI003F647518